MTLNIKTYREAVLILQGILHAEDVYRRLRTLPELPFVIAIRGAKGLKTYDAKLIGNDWQCVIDGLMVVPRQAVEAVGDLADMTFTGNEESMLSDIVTAKFILPVW